MLTAYSARVWTLGARWTTLIQNGWFCDLLGTPYAPVSKIPSVNNNYISQELNINVTTNCFISRGQDNNQATKLRVSKNKDKQWT